MLLFLAADRREFAGLITFCRDVSKPELPVHWARTGRLNGQEVLAIANGAGTERAAQAVEAAARAGALRGVCNTGFCGALDEGLSIGDVFAATSVRFHGREFRALPPVTKAHYAAGILESIDHVAGSAREKRQLRQTGAMAVEMEAGGAAAKAAELGLPFYCIRAVSDLAGETFSCDFNAALRADGQFDTTRLLTSAMRHPVSRFPELFRLQRRCAIASKNLGAFLAGCEF
ncbi:MAG: hypothetical protein M3Z85_21900 [Acidobacteriota bacterium]|nr:hypothetical protein [Acidobacteriota bacterium]